MNVIKTLCPECNNLLIHEQKLCHNCSSIIGWRDKVTPILVGYDLSLHPHEIGNNHPIYHFVTDTAGIRRLKIGLYTKKCFHNCSFCSINKYGSDGVISREEIISQVKHTIESHSSDISKLDMVAIDNSGSIFDYRTITKDSLSRLIDYLNGVLPQRVVFCFETRLEYIDKDLLEYIKIKYKRKIWLQIGFETSDDEVRNKILKKGLNRDSFEKKLDELKEIIVGFSFFILVKSSYKFNEEQGFIEAKNTLDYLINKCSYYNYELLIRANAMYAIENTEFGIQAKIHHWEPPTLLTLAKTARYAIERGVKIQVGLCEEGDTNLENTFWKYPESTNYIYTKLYEINHTQRIDQIDHIIQQYGKEHDLRNPNLKFKSYKSPLCVLNT
jgi:radical SAM enzyme (TIGR01210 family)